MRCSTSPTEALSMPMKGATPREYVDLTFRVLVTDLFETLWASTG
jgi:hypothetical protein